MASHLQGSVAVNTHAAMTPELMRDLRARVHGMRSMENLSDLEGEKKPSLIVAGKRSGSFVKQRQDSLIRSASSSQSSLNSPRSEHSMSFSTSDLSRPASVNLPRIPSKTLKDRGIVHVTRRTDVIKIGDVKRPASTGEIDGERKIRKLSFTGSRNSSFSSAKQSSSVVSSPRSIGAPFAIRDSVKERFQRQNSETSDAPKTSTSVSKRSSFQSDRKSSFSSDKSSPRQGDSPTSALAARNSVRATANADVGPTSERRKSFGRQDSASSGKSDKDVSISSQKSDKSAKDRSFSVKEGDRSTNDQSFTSQKSDRSAKNQSFSSKENGRRSSAGDGSFHMSFTSGKSSSVKSASSKAVSAKPGGYKHRPSFHNIQGSSTPVTHRSLSRNSSSSSSSSLPLPSPPPVADANPSFVPPLELPLPSPPPSPPPPPPPPLSEPSHQEANLMLFQPRSPSHLSAYPLPTPPPTPTSVDDPEERMASVSVPTPPPSPPPTHVSEGAFPPPQVSSSNTSSSFSSPRSEEGMPDLNTSMSGNDFLAFLPDLGHDDTDGRRPLMHGGTSTTTATTMKTESKTFTTETVHNSTKTMFDNMEVGDTVAGPSASLPVIHFPPPPAYSPSSSPSLRSAHLSVATSPMSPSFPGADHSRLISTSTDVVLGYFDSTLANYSSAPVTPTPFRAFSTSLSSPMTPVSPAFAEEESVTGQNTPPPKTRENNFFEFQSHAQNEIFSQKTDITLESQNKTKAATIPPVVITSEDQEPLKTQKKREKGGKHRKRKLTPTQVTKYEGSVKTVRRQIKPGHVEELKEIFKQQDQQDEEMLPLRRHGNRRHRRGSSNNDDDSGSGYTTTSSDNEYDLETAEMINSPDYSTSSPFFSPKSAANYDINWDTADRNSTSTSSSGELSMAASRPSNGDANSKASSRPPSDLIVSEKDVSQQDTGLMQARGEERVLNGRGGSSSESSEAETDPSTINNVMSSHTETFLITNIITTTPTATTTTLATALSQPVGVTENYLVVGRQFDWGDVRDGEGQTTTTTTSTLFTPASQPVRLSVLHQEGRDSSDEKESRYSTLHSSLDPTARSGDKSTAAPSITLTALTGSHQREMDSSSSSNDSSDDDTKSKGEETGKALTDDIYARGDNARPDKDTVGREEESEGGEVAGEKGRKTSSSANVAKESDTVTSFWANKHANDDDINALSTLPLLSAPQGQREEAEWKEHDSDSEEDDERTTRFASTFSSSTSISLSPPPHPHPSRQFDKDEPITHFPTGLAPQTVTGPSLTGTHTQLYIVSSDPGVTSYDTGLEATTTVPGTDNKAVAANTSASQPADFFSILDNIRLDTEGFTPSTAAKARKFQQESRRNTVEVSTPSNATKAKDDTDGRAETQETVVKHSVDTKPSEALTSAVTTLETDVTKPWDTSSTATRKAVLIDFGDTKTPGDSTTAVTATETDVTKPWDNSSTVAKKAVLIEFGDSKTTADSTTAVTATETDVTKTTTTTDSTAKSEKDGKMTAVLGELSSFMIRKNKEQSRQSVSESVVSRSSTLTSPGTERGGKGETVVGVEENAGDVYVYRDSKGDVYVMEDITDQPTASSTTTTTSAFARSAYDDSTSGVASFDFQGLSSSDSLLVETDNVDVTKAKEVISAFFTNTGDDQQPGRHAHNENVRGQSSVHFVNDQQDMTPHKSSAQYDVISGNVGVGGAVAQSVRGGEARGGAGVQRNNSGTYVSKVNVFRNNNDVTKHQYPPQEYAGTQSVYQYGHPVPQRQVDSITVSTNTTAVVGEQSELQIKIPSSAVPVLPTRIQSPTTRQSIAPMLIDDRSPPRKVYTSQRSMEMKTAGNTNLKNLASLGNENELWSKTNYRSERSFGRGGVRRDSRSSVSSEEDGSNTKYRISRLSRNDSYEQSKPFVTSGKSYVNSEQSYVTSGKKYTGTVYDSADTVQKSPPYYRATHTNTNTNTHTHTNTNTSFGDNDSQYGSQTSKATSAGDISPTDEALYRIVRGDNSPPSLISPSPLPSPRHNAYSSTLDRHSRATKDYHQRDQYRSQNASGTTPAFESSEILHHRHNASDGVWRVNGAFSRSEPELSLPLLGTTLSSFTPSEEDFGSERYRLVRTAHNGEKLRTRSSSGDSDTDSGVGGSKRYRAVTRVEIQGNGSQRRSRSAGSKGSGHFSLRPRSPSPSSRNYRLSKVERQSSWERRKEEERSDLDSSLYQIEKVSTSDDWSERQGSKAVYRTVDSVRVNSRPGTGDENNNSRAFRLVHTLPTDKTVTDEQQHYRASQVTAHHRSLSPARKGFSSFDETVSYKARSASPSRPPRELSPTSPRQHRTVITLQVNQKPKISPASQYTETDSPQYTGTDRSSQYKVVQTKAADNYRGLSRSTGDISNGNSYSLHNHSLPSPVSGYESDMERHTSSRVYNVNTSHAPRSASPGYDNYPTGDKRYVVNTTKPSSGKAYVEEERVTLREVKPRVSSPPPATHRSSGEWHKTTVDISRNVNKGRTVQHTMAPIDQHKSYVVFNSMDNIRDVNRDVTSRPMQRSTSQNMSSERQFVVTSPTPSKTPERRSFHQDVFVESGSRVHVSSPPRTFLTSPPRTTRVETTRGVDETDTYRREVYEEKSFEVRTESGHMMPEIDESEEAKDLRVLRGKILIQNRLDDSRDQDDFLDNMNVFDSSFHLGKDNPLYQSDPDIYKSLESEIQREEGRRIGQEVTQDITFEKVDKIAQRQRSGDVQLSPTPRKKQTLSALLLSKLASIDSKDIRQTIDVQHHNEEIYGDVALVHADGSRAHKANTSTFDSVNENVELMLKQGKAFVIIKVIAERIVPIDFEFNVWRKSQAIVTRNIEIDLKATEQRRRLYEHVMERAGHTGALEGSRGAYGEQGGATLNPGEEDERQLSSLETLRLFSQILEVAEGKGEVDDTEMRTRQEMGMLPGPAAPSAMDLLY